MFAIFTTGGKQYKVQKNEVLKVEKLDAEKNVEFSFFIFSIALYNYFML